MTADLLAWVIGVGNPLSALLTGPLLTRLAKSGRIPRSWVFRAQGVGWAVLGVAQAAFLAFGVVSGLAGFRYAQPLMIVVAAVNFGVWWSLRPRGPLAESLLRLREPSPEALAEFRVALERCEVTPSGVLILPDALLKQSDSEPT